MFLKVILSFIVLGLWRPLFAGLIQHSNIEAVRNDWDERIGMLALSQPNEQPTCVDGGQCDTWNMVLMSQNSQSYKPLSQTYYINPRVVIFTRNLPTQDGKQKREMLIIYKQQGDDLVVHITPSSSQNQVMISINNQKPFEFASKDGLLNLFSNGDTNRNPSAVNDEDYMFGIMVINEADLMINFNTLGMGVVLNFNVGQLRTSLSNEYREMDSNPNY